MQSCWGSTNNTSTAVLLSGGGDLSMHVAVASVVLLMLVCPVGCRWLQVAQGS